MARFRSKHWILALAVAAAGGCATCPWCGRPMNEESRHPLQDPAAQTQRVLKGSVTYLQRVAMHPAANIQLRLWDFSGADARPILVSEKILERPGEVPVEFEMTLETGLIDARREYGISARIVVDGKVLFATDTDYRVLTQGYPSTVQLVLSRPVPSASEP